MLLGAYRGATKVEVEVRLRLRFTLNQIFGGAKISDLSLLRLAAAWTLGTYTYPPYVGVGLPIGTRVSPFALLL